MLVMDWTKFRLKPDKDLKLSKIITRYNFKQNGKKQLRLLTKDIEGIAKFQYKLYAEKTQSLLIILQGMDGSGKDGTIRHIMSGINPQGVLIHSFKHPTDEELEHDFLWRHTQKLPDHGQITIFNRSHYENVLISKVHPELVLAEHLPGIDSADKIDHHFWSRRYSQINRFEKNVVQNGTQVLKFFLHLSKDEQRNRFLERIEKKKKHWKFSADDIAERKFWNDYQLAYEQALKNTGTGSAPWFIIPADDKLSAHLLITKIILEKLKEMDPVLPGIDEKEKRLMKRAGKKLKKEYMR